MSERPLQLEATDTTERRAPAGVAALAATTGRFIRAGRKRAGGLPGISATADTIAARHCVDLLAELLKEQPADPRRHVWLAEGLARTRADIRTWSRVRAVADPSSILVTTALRRAATLGDEGREAARQRPRRPLP